MNNQITRVLLVEDSPTDAAIALDALEQGARKGLPFDVQHVERLAAAVESLASDDFDVVMLDLDLPDSRGLDTLYDLRRADAAVPIVICSGLEDEDTAVEALKRGAQDYLVKGRATAWITRRTLRVAIARKRAAEQFSQ